ncbi:non-ribosomal peptide synthetase [Marinobacter sp. DS40M6]|uniref:non-ribosomal peptide synthetase n=1 Tax=Marinobacter sp. DS40M6 TaxID=1597776 RepID=UPI0023586CBC|nr:non-ribosomal peptide synthetase [Marinobacter sp. DS40M6]MDC8455651.1 amino acid adenylation domain-containing protein [Marinobacter sp. DS40M6]
MSSASFNPFAGGELLRVAPATGPQREIIASAQLSDVANTAFNEAVSVKLSGNLDANLLRQCFDDLIAKHDILRATFSRNGTEICLHDTSTFQLEVEDLSGGTPSEQEAAIRDLWKNIAISPMNLEEGPLLFAWLMKLDSNTHELVLAAHHIVCDGWSIGLMLTELAESYGSQRAQSDDSGADISFFDYAEMVDSKEISNIDNDYWSDRFAEVPPNLDLPLDYPRPHFRTFEATRLDYRIDPELAKRLPKTAAAMKVSMVNMVLASYFVLLHRLTSSDDIVVGLPVAGQATQNRLKQVGHMVHLLPIRAQLTPDTRFSELCKQVKSEVLNASEHSNFTFGKLIEAINVDRTRVPLINTIFNIDQPLESIQFGDIEGKVRTVPRAAENFEMFLNILPSSDSLTIEATYSTALFSEATIVSWLEALERILATATADVEIAVGSIALAEQEPNVVQRANDTQRDMPHGTVIDALQHHVSATPDAFACAFGDRSWTYPQLDERSNAVAASLANQGIAAGNTVAVCVERSDAALAAIVGILKLGAIYLPLDPDFPEARLQYMIEDSEASAVIVDSQTPAAIAGVNLLKVDINEAIEPASAEASPVPPVRIDPEQTAYIIYTSGSTGKPKGVLVPHRALINFLESMSDKPGCTANDRLLAVTTFSFDISFLELLLPLTQGATTVIADKDSVKDGEKLRRLILDHQISIMQATPATWRMLLDTDWRQDGVRMKGLCGGEPLPQDLVRDLLGCLDELWNMYGPTETTVWSTCHPLRLTDKLISIGKPIHNTQVHILDRERNPVPLSCPGELYIGGLGLATGYHNRPDLTSEKYIDHPLHGRLYATGDLAKWTPDGNLQHLGRMDDQVKVRGYRIELGDIESALAACADIKSACAYVWELAPGDARIVGCVVSESGDVPNVVSIRKELRKLLPAYMIPQYIIAIDSIPLSPSGKMDRRRLPKPELRESSILKASALANQTEEMLADVWSDVLNSKSRIVREDNFFSLGGHSLLALQAIRRIESQTGIKLTPEDIVGLSLSEIAEKVSHSTPASAGHEDSPADLPTAQRRLLSHEQTRLLLRQLSYPDNVCNNLPASWFLEGNLDIDTFTRSLIKVFERQTALRTVITQVDSRYQQGILPVKQVPVLDVVDLTGEDNPEQTALKRSRDLAFKPFKVLDRPLFRSTLFVLGDARYHYVFVPHQLVFDGWSFDIFLKELEDAYLVQSNTEREKANKLAFEFRDYAEWSIEKGASTEDVDYHRAKIAGVLESGARENENDAKPNQCARETLNFPEASLAMVEKVGNELGLKLHEILFCLFAETISRSHKDNRIVLGVPTSGRQRADVINLIGSFVTTIPCLLQAPSSSFRERIASLGDQLRETLDHQTVTYADIVRNTPAERELFPEFVQASFAFQDIRNRPTSIADLALRQLDLPRLNTEYPVEFWVRIQPGGFIGVFDYNEASADSETVQSLKETFAGLVADLERLINEAPSEPSQSKTPVAKKPFWRKLFQS